MIQKSILLEGVRSILKRGVTGSGSTLSCIAHPNGFLKIVLDQLEQDDLEYRIHVWPPNVTGDIHSHRSAFSSVLVQGSLLEETFAEETGIGYQKNVVKSNDERGEFEMEFAGICSLRKVGQIEVDLAKLRLISQITPHRITSGNGAAVTVAAKAPALASRSYMYAQSDLCGLKTFRKTVPVERAPQDLLLRILTLIEQID